MHKLNWRGYWELCKPRVVMLMVLTSLAGMYLASFSPIPWSILIWGNLGIALAAASAAAVNHLADHHIDRLMQRTQNRPIVQGKISILQTLLFALVLCIASMVLLLIFTNVLTAVLTFLSIIAYAGIYTYYLKHATSQNIVIGGVAGAAPPLLGWVAVTGHIDPPALLLLLIIFVWTPPHFWALAIHRVEDYAKAKVPMLPNTHGILFTKRCIVLYTILLFAVCLLPFLIDSSSWVYLLAALILNSRFLQWTIRLYRSDDKAIAMKTFRFSIIYLMALFMALLLDHYLVVHGYISLGRW